MLCVIISYATVISLQFFTHAHIVGKAALMEVGRHG